MADAASAAGATPLLAGLPDEISIWEILVRLPPKDLLRCRAVCPAWRCATSTHDFLLAHHARQPTLPLICCFDGVGDDDDDGEFLDIIPFNHRAGLTTADQLHPVARLQRQRPTPGHAGLLLDDSCDGLLCLYNHNSHYAICNPATRQYAPLRQIDGFAVIGMYPHRPTGEYRLLLYPDWLLDDDWLPLPSDLQDGCHVFTLGSCQPPRHIGWPEAGELVFQAKVLFRGNLHWYAAQPESKRDTIMVFDTTAESFRWMHAPVLSGDADLFEMEGRLVIASFNDPVTIIGIWILEDYESKVWTFKWKVELPVTEIRVRCEEYDHCSVTVVPTDGELFVLVRFNKWLLQVDMDGKLVATFHCRGVCPNHTLHLKQTLVQHSFFPSLEGYVVNDSPFI